MNILKNDKDMLTSAFAGQHIFFYLYVICTWEKTVTLSG